MFRDGSSIFNPSKLLMKNKLSKTSGERALWFFLEGDIDWKKMPEARTYEINSNFLRSYDEDSQDADKHE